MEFRHTGDKRGPALFAGLALLVVGAGLIFLTWGNLRQQRDILNDHMLLSARVIMRGVESGIMRGLRRSMGGQPGGHMSSPNNGPGNGPMGGHMESRKRGRMAFDQDAGEFFRDMAESGDVRSLAIIGPRGDILYSSGDPIPRPGVDMTALRRTGSWSAIRMLKGKSHGDEQHREKLHETLYLAQKASPVLARFCSIEHSTKCDPGDPVYILIGLGVDEYFEQYRAFRQAAMLQTGFVIVAASILMLLFGLYLRRRERDRAFIQLERFHSRLLDTMPDALLSVDELGRVHAANPAASSILGMESATITGRELADIFPDIFDKLRNETGWIQTSFNGRELEILSRPIPEEDECLLLIRDRTQIKNLESRLATSERLASLGKLAASVAHEIRNPLSSLRGFAQFFMSKFKDKQPEEEYAATMVREADRLNRVITDMLFLSKPHSLNHDTVSIETVFSELEKLLELDLKEKSVTLQAELETPEVVADTDSLKQVLLNLVMNGLAAVPEQGGVITVGSNLVQDAEDDGVIVSVSDNGSGMTDEVRAKAFELFYTTRQKGTGLGLAIVHNMMAEHGGSVDIVSAPGKGTEVLLFFPNNPPEKDRESDAPSDTAEPKAQS